MIEITFSKEEIYELRGVFSEYAQQLWFQYMLQKPFLLETLDKILIAFDDGWEIERQDGFYRHLWGDNGAIAKAKKSGIDFIAGKPNFNRKEGE